MAAESAAPFHDPRAQARNSTESDADAILRRVLLDQDAAARERLRLEISRLLAVIRDSATFERRLYSLACDAAILDGARLVQLVQAGLPKNARLLRFAARRVLARLHLAAANECDRAGYARFAAAHLLRGALLEPAVLVRRRSLGILARYLATSNRRNRHLRAEAARAIRLLDGHGLCPRVFGSLAISLNAGRFVKRHGDIDLVFPSEADTRRAAAVLVDDLEYRVAQRHEWIGLTGERCFHIALNGPGDIRVELSYLPENPGVNERVVTVHGVRVHTADLPGLRNIYALFLVKRAAASHDLEKQSKKSAILTIDRLLP